MNEVYGRSRDKDCQENNKLSPWLRENGQEQKNIKGSKCDYFSNAYRCSSFEDYLKTENLTDEQNKMKIELIHLQTIQQRLFGLLKNSQFKLSKNEVKDYLGLADKESDKALIRLREENLDKLTEMLVTLKYFSAEGIRKSLELANLTEPTERL